MTPNDRCGDAALTPRAEQWGPTRKTTVEEVNATFTEESETRRYEGVLGVSDDPIVSSDMSWYDNEWGYASQMVREARTICSAVGEQPR